MIFPFIIGGSCNPQDVENTTETYTGGPTGGIYNVIFFEPVYNDDGSVELRIQFSDNRQSIYKYFYYIVIKRGSDIVKISDSIGAWTPFNDSILTLVITPSDDLTADYYTAYIYACYEGQFPSWDAFEHSYKVGTAYYDWDGGSGECDNQYYYVTAYQYGDDLVGVSANIKSRYGKLCKDGVGPEHAHSCVYAGVNYNSPAESLWAQSGFIKIREEGATNSIIGRYIEVQGLLWYFALDSLYHGSYEGAERIYKIKLDTNTASWYFYDNDIQWINPVTDSFWLDKMGNSIQWTGEIYGRETDMAGTWDNPCIIMECEFWHAGYETSTQAHIYPYNIYWSDSAEWFIDYISPTSVKIWDKYPQ